MAPNFPRILVVEDEYNVGVTLVERLEREGFKIVWAKSVIEAKNQLMSGPFALALIDVGLPDGSGFDVGKAIRGDQPTCAIVFLTAFGDPEDRIKGLELGAEDYIVKPFHFKELLLRIKNSLKRVRYLADDLPNSQELSIGKAIVHLTRFQIERDGQIHSLTHKECALLKFLLDRRGKVVSREEILDFVWANDEFPTPRTVDNFIMRLRRLIEIDPDNPSLIKSVRGVGYQLQ